MSDTLLKSNFNEQALHNFLDNRREANWMKQYRQKALSAYNKLPWPSTKDEEWRRTNISHIDFNGFELQNGYHKSVTMEPVDKLADLSGSIKFKGNVCIAAQMKKSLGKKGVIFTTLSDAILYHSDLVQPYFMKIGETEKFLTLNESFWNHGIFLYIPPFTEIEQPFLTLFDEIGNKKTSFPYILIIMEKGSRAQFYQEIHSRDEGEIFRNSVISMNIAEAASLKYIEIQQLNEKSLNFSNGWASMGRAAELSSLIATFGSALTKARFGSSLKGQGANAKLQGIYFADQHQHFDQRTIQHHESPDATSNLLYKGAVKDRAHSIYQGLIKVFPDAQKTDAYQANKNLVLNDHARADSIPSLEIEADDVRCSHGSTVGCVSEDEIFYLRSRGIPYKEAKKIIVSGFFEDILIHVPHDLQLKLRLAIETELESIEEV